jgi:hypothetical protein
MKPSNYDPSNMTYNSAQEHLIMPEYGRNVQELIKHAVTIENDDYRQAFCEEIIVMIQQLYPQSKMIEDYKDKLWKHIFYISDYKLNVKTPSGDVPSPEDARKRPEPVPYPVNDTRFRHYGNNVFLLVKKALTMEEGSVKDGFVHTIGSYMKLAYKTWNREHYVSDDIIKNDLSLLSNGKLTLKDEASIDALSNSTKLSTINNKNNTTQQTSSRSNNNGSNNRTSNNTGGSGNNRPNNGPTNRPSNNNTNNSNNNRTKKY